MSQTHLRSPCCQNSVYAPVRNPRVRWRSDALEHPTPQLVLPPVVSTQNVPAATPSWSPPLPVTRETPSTQQPVTPHVDIQSEFPPPAPTADDDPIPLPHVDDTPQWVVQEPETPCISTEQDTPVTIPQQVPLPPIQVPPSREETNVSTGDSIILPPPWFDETPQPSSIHEDVLPPVSSFDETPFVRAPVPETPTIPSVAKRWRSGTLHPVPETPTIPSVAKSWRSGTLHLEIPVSKRWRSDTLHPETPVPTTTPPQLRWRAGVLRALRPFRRLRDTQSDPSERVKRSRLAPAQVMMTTVAKHGDWSLDFEERGPVFDGAQDWRHSVSLTGRAARNEVASEPPENQRLLLAAMEREWKKWEEHKATLPLTQGQLRMLKSRFPNLKIVGTRLVLTPKEPDFKARLVVQGCQEDPSMMRTDSPTGSRDSFFPGSFLRSTGTLELWFCRCRFCVFASRRHRAVALAHDAKTSTATRM